MNVLASTLGEIFSPVFDALTWLLAIYYDVVPNYFVAIALLTVTVMIVSFPLNRASTRSMFKMQLLQPEMMKIRKKYTPGKDVSATERQEMRQKQNEEMMALYRENNTSMLGGCLPNLAVFPIFIVLYDVVRGLTSTCIGAVGQANVCASAAAIKVMKHPVAISSPRYISHSTSLYHNLIANHGQILFFGINLADSVRTPQAAWFDVLPFVAFVGVAVALQYYQFKQMTRRNPGAANAPGASQMQTMQKVMPLIMAVIYVSIPAAVNVYFMTSSVFRIGQQEWMYRRDPQITSALRELHARKSAAGSKKLAPSTTKKKGPGTVEPDPEPSPPPRGWRNRLAAALAVDSNQPPEAEEESSQSSQNGKPTAGSKAPASRPKPTGPGTTSGASRSSAAGRTNRAGASTRSVATSAKTPSAGGSSARQSTGSRSTSPRSTTAKQGGSGTRSNGTDAAGGKVTKGSKIDESAAASAEKPRPGPRATDKRERRPK